MVEPNVPSIAYNIALMKFCRLCEDFGYEYEYVRGMIEPNIIPDKIIMSFIFTFYANRYEKIVDYYLKRFPEADILIGGVFPSINPRWFKKDKWKNRVKIHQGKYLKIENLIPKYNTSIIDEDVNKSKRTIDKMILKKKKIVTYASRGCVNKCGYCVVPKLEGNMKSFKSIIKTLEIGHRELPQATSVVLYDNNFTEHRYIDNIIDELIDFGLPVDIHGLHVESFSEKIAKRFSQLKWASQNERSGRAYLRFSFDKMKYEKDIENALKYTIDFNINADFFCYMLYNWTDSPDDFWYRMVTAQKLATKYGKMINLFPQRFEPFSALRKNRYVGKNWNTTLLNGIHWMLSWSHGFLTLTPSKNLFRWFGYSKEEFFENCFKLAEDKNQKIQKKKEGDVPNLIP